MTMPANTIPRDLPAPEFPVLRMMFTDNLTPAGNGNGAEAVILWQVGELHPYASNVRVSRMFFSRVGGVAVYSAADNGDGCVRDLIPMNRIRIVQEVMPFEVFAEEIDIAETERWNGEPEPEPEPEPDPELEPEPPANDPALPS